jgi:sugar lactone lactonase YvrE
MDIINSINPRILLLIFSSFLVLSCQEEKINPDKFDLPVRKGPRSPEVNEISPSTGTAGTQVIITGKYFSPHPSENTVLFNGVTAEVIEASPFVLLVEAPSNAGSGPVTVITHGRESVSGPVFTYLSALYITTFAGSQSGYVDGPLSVAQFKGPTGIVGDNQGNFYVADGNRIRKISSDGIVTTLAGAEGTGYADGTGTDAMFYYPSGLALDPQGNIIVAEYGNSTIRKVTPEGVVTTIAGRAEEWGYVDGHVSVALFDSPLGIDVDQAGNIIIADYFNHRIRKISPAGIVSTIAGSGPLGYDGGGHQDGEALSAILMMPNDLVIDQDNGDVYFTESSAVVRKLSGGIVSTVAGSALDYGMADGPAESARFHGPYGIDIDAENSLYVVDDYNNRVRKISTDGMVSTYAGTGELSSVDGPVESGTLYLPRFLHLGPDNALYVTEPTTSKIRKISIE